jgi:hypothetical protein
MRVMTDDPAPGHLVTVRNRMWVASDGVSGSVGTRTATSLTAKPPTGWCRGASWRISQIMVAASLRSRSL